MRTHSWYLEGARLAIRWLALVIITITNVHSPVVLFLSSCHTLHPRGLYGTLGTSDRHTSQGRAALALRTMPGMVGTWYMCTE